MRLWAIATNRLAFALLDAQQINDRPSEQEDEHQGRNNGTAGPKCDVTKHIEKRNFVGQLGQPVEHWVDPEISPLRRRLLGHGLFRKLPFQSPDDWTHFGTERALHHDRIARLDSSQYGRF